MVRYSHKTNLMIQQILMDPSATQLTFVFQNQRLRRFKGEEKEVTLNLEQLQNPIQTEEYLKLRGDVFPEVFPFNYSSTMSS